MAKSKAEKPTGSCNCIDQVNAQLRGSNAKLSQGLQIDFKTGKSSMSPPMLVAEKIDSKIKKRLPSLLCSFCPFCGSKYPE